MIDEVICKFWNTKYNIGVTDKGEYLALKDGKVKQVIKEVHCGSIHYRIKGTGIRASKAQLNKKENLTYNKVIQEYCPF
jgi:hypothetical protein